MYVLSYITANEHETLNAEWLTPSDDMGLTFYGDLLSASCRVAVLFMKTNEIPYIDTQATAIRRGMFAA